MAKSFTFSNRFNELLEQAKAIEATKIRHTPQYVSDYDSVNNEMFLGWKVKSRHLLNVVCGVGSEHYKDFVKIEEPKSYRDQHQEFCQLKAIIEAAKEDYEGGYLNSVRNLIHAEVFSSELDQAEELLKNGYYVAAAVIAGVVLETSLRKMCVDLKIDPGSLNRMNSDLVKADAYNLLMQKKITALADIRNNAAHGNSQEFTLADVKLMISDVERFISDKL